MNTQKTAEPADVETKDGRVFRWLAELPHVRQDGTSTALNVWHSPCEVCGAPFFVTTAEAAVTTEKTNAFGAKHCQVHKLTPAEVRRRGRAAQRATRKARS